VSDCDQVVSVDNTPVQFLKNEIIHTENSYKYTPENFIALAAKAGFRFEQQWVDKDELFGVYYFSVI